MGVNASLEHTADLDDRLFAIEPVVLSLLAFKEGEKAGDCALKVAA